MTINNYFVTKKYYLSKVGEINVTKFSGFPNRSFIASESAKLTFNPNFGEKLTQKYRDSCEHNLGLSLSSSDSTQASVRRYLLFTLLPTLSLYYILHTVMNSIQMITLEAQEVQEAWASHLLEQRGSTATPGEGTNWPLGKK